MPVITWDNSFQTGHPLVDPQHRELFRMVNELHEAIVEGRGREVLNPTLDKLVKYTVDHFGAEESLMREVSYPGYHLHRGKHIDLTKKVADLVGTYQRGELVVSITLSRFLADWLQHHIKEDDMALIRFVQTCRPVAAPLAMVK